MLLTYVHDSFLMEFVEIQCSIFASFFRPCIYMARVSTIPVNFSILDLNEERRC